MRNRLNRKKFFFSDFSDFYFSSYGHFWSFLVIFVFKSPQFSMNFHDNSKNENWKIDISFVSAHSASFIKSDHFWGRGLHIYSWDRANIDKSHRVCIPMLVHTNTMCIPILGIHILGIHTQGDAHRPFTFRLPQELVYKFCPASMTDEIPVGAKLVCSKKQL